MNSLDGDRVFFRSLATRGGRERARAPRRRHRRRCKAAGLRPRHRRDAGHRAGRRRDRRRSSTSPLRDDAGVRRRVQLEKIDMLDFADVVAINKFERRGAKDALRDVGRQLVRNREAFGKQPEDMPVFGTSRPRFNDDGVTALYQHLRDLLAERGLPSRPSGALARGRRPALDRRCARSSRRPGCATSPRSPRPCAATTPTPTARRGGAPRAAADGRSRPSSSGAGADEVRRRRAAARGRATALAADVADQLAAGRRSSRRYSGDEQVVTVRDREIHTRSPGVAVGQPDPPRRPAPLPPTTASCCASCAGRTCPALPVHRRRVPVQARRRGPGPDVRRRGRPVPHQPPLQAALRRASRPPGCRPRSTR